MKCKYLYTICICLASIKIGATNYVYNNGGVTTPLTMVGTDTLTVQAGTMTYNAAPGSIGTVNNDATATNINVTVNPGAFLTRGYVGSSNTNIGAVALSSTTTATINNQGEISSAFSSAQTFIDSSMVYFSGANTITVQNSGIMSSDVTSTSGTAGAHAVRGNVSPNTNNYSINITNSGSMLATAKGVSASTPTVIDLGTGRLQSGSITNTGTIRGTTATGSAGFGAPLGIRINAFNDDTFNIDNQGTIELINNNSAITSGIIAISSSGGRTITITNSGSISAIDNASSNRPRALSGTISQYTQTGSGSLTGDVNISAADAVFTHNSTGNVNGNLTFTSGNTSVLYINNTGGITGSLTGFISSLIIGNDTVTPNFVAASTITDFSTIQVIKGSFTSGGTISSVYDSTYDAGSGTINIGHNMDMGSANLTTSGNINFTAGTITLNNLINNGTINVSNSASMVLNAILQNTSSLTFAGGTVVADGINNSGTLYTSSPTTFNFSGTTFTNSGTLRLIFNDENNFSSMQATSATIDSSIGTIQVDWGGGNGQNLPAGEYTLIQGSPSSTASVGTFIQPTYSNTYIKSMLASISGSNVILTVIKQGGSTELVGTTTLSADMAIFLNQVSASTPTTAQNQLINALTGITSQDQLNNSLQSLTPVINGPMQVITLQQQNQMLIANRRNNLILTKYYSSGDDGYSYGIWLRPFLEGGRQSNDGTLQGYNAYTNGVVLGFDHEFNRRNSAGIALSYAGSVVKSINYVNTSSHIKTYLATLYGTYNMDNNIALDWLGSAGFNRYSGKRLINVAPVYVLAEADYVGQQYALSAALRRDLLYKNLLISPQISANYIYLNQSAYSETNAGTLGYSINSYHPNVFTLGAGATFSSPYQDKLHTFIPLAKAIIYYDVKSAAQNVTSAFITGGPVLQTLATPGRITGQIGLSLMYKISQRLSLDINYDLFVKNKYHNNVAYFNLNYIF